MASTPVSDILTNQWPSSTMMNVCHTWSHFLCRTLSQNQISKHEEKSRLSLEPVCCKKQQKKVPDQLLTANPFPVMTTGISLCSNSTLFFPVRDCSAGLWDRGPLKDLNDSKLIVYESKSFPQSPDHKGSILYQSKSSNSNWSVFFSLFLTANRLY